MADTTRPRGTLIGPINFAPPLANPYGLADVGNSASPSFVDIDGDGDLDALIGNLAGNTIVQLNTGSDTSPAFAPATINPYGLVDVGYVASPSFVDIDGDGDLDALIGTYSGNTLLQVNTGSVNNPAFAAATTNPYNLADTGTSTRPSFVDIDGEGDLDALIGNSVGNTLVQLNTGGATSPGFAAATTNPYGLVDVGYNASLSFVDIDGDGDLDALIGNTYGNTVVQLNIGDTTSAAFAAAITNPYSLGDAGTSARPSFVDIDGDGDLDGLIGNGAGNTVVQLNTANPVAPVTAITANGNYGVGSVITLTVVFNETILVTGTPRLTLETGTIDRHATYVSGSGTSTLSFSYTVQPGDTSADLDQTSSYALALNGGTIGDAAGNKAILSLAAPGAVGSLGANHAIVIDTLRPTATLAVADTSLTVGETSGVTITFSEAVTGLTTADLSVGSGVVSALTTADGGVTWTATLTPMANTVAANNIIRLDNTGIADLAGNVGAATTASNTYAVETTRPAFSSASAIGINLVMTYTDASNLNAVNIPVTGAFAVATGGATNAVTAVAVNAAAKTVTLTLIRAITFGEVIFVAYTDPTAGDDANAIQDSVGNDAASLTATAATNNTATPPTPVDVPNLDADGDGVPTAQENLVPALTSSGLTGDGNGDGALDSGQVNVASAPVPGNPNSFMTVVTDSTKGINDPDPGQAAITNFLVQAPLAGLPSGGNLPNPISFNTAIGTAGQTETFSIFVDANANPNGYWIRTANGAWNNIATSIETVGQKVRIDFAISDGGAFDADGMTNGSIAVTGGAGSLPLTLVGQPPDLPPGDFWF